MKVIYYTATSLDGYIADKNHNLDWLFQFGEEPGAGFDEFLGGIGAIVMGSSTYQWLLDHLGSTAVPAWPYRIPSWIFTTRRLPHPDGADVRFVSGKVEPVYRAMSEAAGQKHIWIVGGGDLAGQFYDCGLLNKLIVTIVPVTLGSGAPLLPRRIHPPLQLQKVQQPGAGFLEVHYTVPASLSSSE